MSSIEAGTYRGIADDLTFEFRVECVSDGQVSCVSGDITRDNEFIASLVCMDPQLSEEGRTITGTLSFRGNPGLVSGSLYLNSDPRGVGSFRVGVNLEESYRDVFAGRLDWQGGFLRRLTIEVDGIEGTLPPGEYKTRNGTAINVARAFEQAGLDVEVVVDPFSKAGSATSSMRGYSEAEIHAAMTKKRSYLPADRLHTHVFVCSYLAGRGNRDVLGLMYDFGQFDLNQRPREGIAIFYDHPLLSDPRVPEEVRQREYVFTAVHEIGHALNLQHSFDKARPSALSWMNYPNLYPRGYQAGEGRDGTTEFWRRFEDRFDEEELRHLHHATPREIRAGGFPFGTYEEGASVPFRGTASPRLTRLGANPLRATRAVNLEIAPLKREYHLGEPVFLSVQASNVSNHPARVPDSLDPSEGYVQLIVRQPNGNFTRYRPPVRLCKQSQLVQLAAGERWGPFDHVPLFLSAEGAIFTEPGNYQIAAEMTGVEGSRNILSRPVPLRILAPDDATEAFATKLWSKPAVMQALYLRHPLVALDDWNEVEEALDRTPLQPGNTTASYFNFIAGLGWMNPFAVPNAPEKSPKQEKALRRFSKVDPRGLPASVKNRKEQLEASKADSEPRTFIVVRPEERMRTEVPPSGLFGSVGLSTEQRERATNPLARVVSTLRGTTLFADIVSWNAENLFREDQLKKIPHIAELVRNFRCDFWGLQEVDEKALTRLTETLNSAGGTRYAFVVDPGEGSHNAALYRTDTTHVERLPNPAGFFNQVIKVEKTNGQMVDRAVFARLPLLCNVRVQQGTKAFDFRCAVVHLKSTESELKDKGDCLRQEATTELLRWLQANYSADQERDYLILGDMNAETAKQGMEAFTKSNDLKLLSVGMQEKYGKEEALTRVASKRLIDHIVLTKDTVEAMPDEDKEEQLIIRADRLISSWTQNLSDHVPVAVRFILGKTG